MQSQNIPTTTTTTIIRRVDRHSQKKKVCLPALSPTQKTKYMQGIFCLPIFISFELCESAFSLCVPKVNK